MTKSVLIFSSMIFLVSALTFRSLIHFEFIFVYGIGSVLVSFFHIQLSSFPSTTYWRDGLFSIVYFGLLCQGLGDYRSEYSLLWENFCDIIIFQFVGCPPGISGIRLCVECAPLLSCCGFFFALDVKCLFLVYAILFCQWLFSSSLWLGVFSWEEVSSGPSTLPSYQMILGSILNELWKVEFI